MYGSKACNSFAQEKHCKRFSQRSSSTWCTSVTDDLCPNVYWRMRLQVFRGVSQRPLRHSCNLASSDFHYLSIVCRFSTPWLQGRQCHKAMAYRRVLAIWPSWRFHPNRWISWATGAAAFYCSSYIDCLGNPLAFQRRGAFQPLAKREEGEGYFLTAFSSSWRICASSSSLASKVPLLCHCPAGFLELSGSLILLA